MKKFVAVVMLFAAAALLAGGCGGGGSTVDDYISSDVNAIANGAWSLSGKGTAEFVIDGMSYTANVSNAQFVLSECDLAKDEGSMNYIGMLVAEGTDSSGIFASTLPCMIYPATVKTKSVGDNSWTATSEYGVSIAFSLLSDNTASLTIDVPYDSVTIHVNVALRKVTQEPEVIDINSALNGTWLTEFDGDGTVSGSGGLILSKEEAAMGHSVWGGFIFSDIDINAGTFKISGSSAMSMRATLKPDRDIVLPSSTTESAMKIRRIFGNTYYFTSAASKEVNGVSDETYGFIILNSAESATVFMAKDFYSYLNGKEDFISGYEIIPLKKRTADTVNPVSILSDSTWGLIMGGGLSLTSTSDVLAGDFLLKSGDMSLTLSNCEIDTATQTANADFAFAGTAEQLSTARTVDLSRNFSAKLSRLGYDVWVAAETSGHGNVMILPASASRAGVIVNIVEPTSGSRFLLAGFMQKK